MNPLHKAPYLNQEPWNTKDRYPHRSRTLLHPTWTHWSMPTEYRNLHMMTILNSGSGKGFGHVEQCSTQLQYHYVSTWHDSQWIWRAKYGDIRTWFFPGNLIVQGICIDMFYCVLQAYCNADTSNGESSCPFPRHCAWDSRIVVQRRLFPSEINNGVVNSCKKNKGSLAAVGVWWSWTWSWWASLRINPTPSQSEPLRLRLCQALPKVSPTHWHTHTHNPWRSYDNVRRVPAWSYAETAWLSDWISVGAVDSVVVTVVVTWKLKP